MRKKSAKTHNRKQKHTTTVESSLARQTENQTLQGTKKTNIIRHIDADERIVKE